MKEIVLLETGLHFREMDDLQRTESLGSEHTTEDQLYDERKEQDKGDMEDEDLNGEFVTRLEKEADENAMVGKDYVQFRPRREEEPARSSRIRRNLSDMRKRKGRGTTKSLGKHPNDFGVRSFG